MSEILLRGLEFPKDGHIIVRIYANGDVCEPTECAGVWGKAATAVQLPSHDRLIDADEFLDRAIGTQCFRGDYALMLEELVGESTTVIPASEDAMQHEN